MTFSVAFGNPETLQRDLERKAKSAEQTSKTLSTLLASLKVLLIGNNRALNW